MTTMKRTRRMRGLFLCSGIGGMELAAEATGLIDVVGQVEVDDFCMRILAYQWPHVKRMRDVKEVQGHEFGIVNLVAAGIPCQPTSHAGKRRGTSDDRWLWPEVHRVIQCARPAWVLLENVAGLITLGLDDVLSDLASAGYEATACVYPASAVGAPHQRERVFIVAHTTRNLRRSSGHDGYQTSDEASDRGQLADTAGLGWRTRRPEPARQCGQAGADECGADVEYARSAGWEECHTARVACDAGHATGRCHTDGCGGQTQSRLGNATHGFPVRLAGHPGWPSGPDQAQAEWEAPRTTRNTIKERAAKLKALGNAVVPQQVYPLFAAIAETWANSQESTGSA